MHKHFAIIAVLTGFIMAAAVPANAQMGSVISYSGHWRIQPNGDVKVQMDYKLSLMDYRKLKDSDFHMMVARGFAADRSPIAVSQPTAEWKDLDRTLTMTVTVQGLARNMGDHWEALILPGLKFSNIDEAKGVAYFHFTNDTDFGRIDGRDEVILPEGASKPAWKDSSRTLTYELPYAPPAAPTVVAATVAETRTVSSSLPTVFLVLFGASLAIGLMLLALSFVPRPPQ